MNYSPFRHIGSVFWKREPLQLTFFVTRRCNAKCPFCFYLSGNYVPETAEDELSVDEIEKISSSMGKLLWLSFSGGEIFLRDDIDEITGVFYRKNSPSIILFPTNGLLPEKIRDKMERILRLCKKSTVVLKLSIDGTEDTHDSLRGVSGAFSRTMETYRLIGELSGRYKNLELGINTVFCSRNQDEMDDVINMVRALDMVRTHTVSLIRGRVSEEGLKDIDTRIYQRTIKTLETGLKKRTDRRYRFRGAGLKTAQDILQRRLIHGVLSKDRYLIPCYAGRLTIVLTETGGVYPCESFRERLGNIRDSGYDLKRILDSEDARRVLNSIRKDNCYCTHECYTMINILFNPLMYPSLLREYVHLTV